MLVLSSLEASVWVTDEDSGEIPFANHHAEKMFVEQVETGKKVPPARPSRDRPDPVQSRNSWHAKSWAGETVAQIIPKIAASSFPVAVETHMPQPLLLSTCRTYEWQTSDVRHHRRLQFSNDETHLDKVFLLQHNTYC
jgi:hypothetical protein